MANAVYPIWKAAIMSLTAGNDIDVDDSTDGPYVSLIDTSDYTYSAAHNFYDDVVAGEVGTPQVIDNPTVTAGTFDGADVTFTSVTGDQCEALVFYRHNSGANSTWPVFLYLDTSQTGLPVTPNGGNITITWNASGIFTLSDRAVKEDIVQVGNIGPANVYEYRYAGSKQRHTGLMAQEVEQFAPHAVREIGGRKRVDYAAAVQAAERLAA